MNITTRLWAATCLLGLAGCSDTTEPSGDMPVAGTLSETGMPCGVDPVVRGMEVTGEHLTVKLLEMAPAPPKIRENDWVVEVRDAEGNPMTDPGAFKVVPWMVAHDHGSPWDPVIEPTDTPGQFRVERVNLWMKGLWDVRFMEPGQERAQDEWTILYVCIQG